MITAALAVLQLVIPWIAGQIAPPSLGPAVKWTIGLVSTCFITMVLTMAGMPFRFAFGCSLAVGLIAGAYGWLTFGSRALPNRRDSAWLLMCLAILCGSLLVLTLATPVEEWDGIYIWYAKARGFLDGLSFLNVEHREYPNLGPTAWGSALVLAGTEYEPAGRLVFALLFAAWVFSLRQLFDAPLRGVTAVVVLVAAISAMTIEITSGYQDTVVMSVAGTAAVLLSRALKADGVFAYDAASLVPGLLLAGTLGLIKNEGTYLGLALVAGWIAAVVYERSAVMSSRGFKLGIVGFGLLIASWPIVLASHGLSPSDGQLGAFDTSSLADLPTRLGRLPHILSSMVHLTPTFTFPILASGLLSVVAWTDFPSARPRLLWLWTTMIIYWSWMCVPFLLTNVDLDWHLRGAVPRLFDQLRFAWTLAIIVAAARFDRAWWTRARS